MSSLPKSKRQAVIDAIRPALWNSFGDIDDADTMEETIAKVTSDLCYEQHNFGSHQLIFLQAHDVEGCGTDGGCLVFVVDHDRSLLSGARASEIAIQATQHHGLPDLQLTLSDHMSNKNRTIKPYQFDGKQYKANHCTLESYEPDGNWSVTDIPCED